MDYLNYKNYLCHHGVKGQKWGVRNEDETAASTKKNKAPLTVKGLLAGAAVGAGSALALKGIGKLTTLVAADLLSGKGANASTAIGTLVVGDSASTVLSTIGGVTLGSIVSRKVSNKNYDKIAKEK